MFIHVNNRDIHLLFVTVTVEQGGDCLDSAAARVSGNHKSCNGFVLLGAGRDATVFSARDPHKSQGTPRTPTTHCSAHEVPGTCARGCSVLRLVIRRRHSAPQQRPDRTEPAPKQH